MLCTLAIAAKTAKHRLGASMDLRDANRVECVLKWDTNSCRFCPAPWQPTPLRAFYRSLYALPIRYLASGVPHGKDNRLPETEPMLEMFKINRKREVSCGFISKAIRRSRRLRLDIEFE